MLRALVVAALIAVSSRVAFAQESLDFVEADRETVAQLARIVASVKAANLPTEPVVAKARLAARVHASPARIVAALQAVAERLDDAREALGGSSPKADIMAGADALGTKGVTKDMLQRIREAQPARSIAVPLGVMAQLVASGVPPRQAADIVTRLVRARATTTQLVALGNDVSQDVIAGAGATSALQIRLETLKPLLAYGAPSAATAADAFVTSSGGGATSPKGPQNPRGRP
jgi:hypothetical protein